MKLIRGARGFALTEMLLAVAVFGIVVGTAAAGYKYAKRASSGNDAAVKLTMMVNDIRKGFRPAASFATINSQVVGKMGVVQKPFYFDGSATIADPWGNGIAFAGADTYFALVLGGNPIMTQEECMAIVAGVEASASEVRVGAGATLAGGAGVGRTTGGYGFKPGYGGVPYDTNAAAVGCAEPNPRIAFSFDS